MLLNCALSHRWGINDILLQVKQTEAEIEAFHNVFTTSYSHSEDSSIVPLEPPPTPVPNTPGDTLLDRCHTGLSPLLADTPHSSPGDQSKMTENSRLKVLFTEETEKITYNK